MASWSLLSSDDLPVCRLTIVKSSREFTGWRWPRFSGLPLLAFDLDREHSRAEMIMLTMQFNHARRVMSREEVALLGSEFMEETGCTAAQASERLHVSAATMSRALGDRRIPAELKPQTDQLPPSTRSLIAAVPPALMGRAVDFALTAGAEGKRPTRDAVALFIRQLKRDGKQPGKPKPIPLRINGRLVTLSIVKGDNAASVAEDLKAIATRLGKHAEVLPDGWPFLFQ